MWPCGSFFDPFIRAMDAGIVEREPRAGVIGMTERWRLLDVVYIEHDEIIRIISARPAKKTERESYEDR